MTLELAHPWALLLLAIPIAIGVLAALRGERGRPALRLPEIAGFAAAPRGLRVRTRWVPLAGRLAALALVAVALARPRGGETVETVTTEGIDIVLVLDTSESMLIEDMGQAGARLNRLEAAKRVAADFVRGRTADRIGLVSFDEIAVPRCPPTLDYDVLLEFLAEVRTPERGGRTAIGTALASGVNRLRESEARSRVIVLVTDGRNNAGAVEPEDAAEMARLLGIRVYTIGIGTEGLANLPVRSGFGLQSYQRVASDVDEETLREIADLTGGRYFRAVDAADLSRIFQHVDALERTPMEVERHVRHHERFAPLVAAAAVVAALAAIAGLTAWRTFP